MLRTRMHTDPFHWAELAEDCFRLARSHEGGEVASQLRALGRDLAEMAQLGAPPDAAGAAEREPQPAL